MQAKVDQWSTYIVSSGDTYTQSNEIDERSDEA